MLKIAGRFEFCKKTYLRKLKKNLAERLTDLELHVFFHLFMFEDKQQSIFLQNRINCEDMVSNIKLKFSSWIALYFRKYNIKKKIL